MYLCVRVVIHNNIMNTRPRTDGKLCALVKYIIIARRPDYIMMTRLRRAKTSFFDSDRKKLLTKSNKNNVS